MSGSEWGSDGKAGELPDPGVGPLDGFPAQPLGGRRGKSVSCRSTVGSLGTWWMPGWKVLASSVTAVPMPSS